MQKYVLLYVAWLAGVLAMAGIAAVWYKRVEEIGLREMAERAFGTATDDTEATGLNGE